MFTILFHDFFDFFGPLNARPQQLIEAAKRSSAAFFFGAADDTGAADDHPAAGVWPKVQPDVRPDARPNATPLMRLTVFEWSTPVTSFPSLFAISCSFRFCFFTFVFMLVLR